MKKILCLMAVSLILSTAVQVASARENSPPGTEITKIQAPVVHFDVIAPAIEGIQIDAINDLNGALTVTRDRAIALVAVPSVVAFAPLLKQSANHQAQIKPVSRGKAGDPIQRE